MVSSFRRRAFPWCLFALSLVAWAQLPPVPRPTPPQEPRPEVVLLLRLTYRGGPVEGVLVALYPSGPNLLPLGRGEVRLTDVRGEARFAEVPPRALLFIWDRKGGLRLQIPLEGLLGLSHLGPYEIEVARIPAP